TGKPYVGYASMQGNQTAQDVLKYRYANDFSRFGGTPPVILYDGYGQKGKDIARGLEQRRFEQLGGLEGTANKQNPVGQGNARRTEYLNAADEHLNSKQTGTQKGGKC
ncbi:RHS repeat-associated core domain-containing protein, partial [Proteus mirabilis]|nr:RHS repeat-associated core domain-containing protein [Proteus mirabilis]